MLSFIVYPLVGGVIGYTTNAIAIKMLFRPRKAKYVAGYRVPFTPGIIPKEKCRIAKAVSGAISENLMSRDVLQRSLLSDEMLLKIGSSLHSFADSLKRNEETVKQFLSHYLSDGEVDNIIDNLKSGLVAQVSEKLTDARIGDEIAGAVVEHVSSKLRIEGLDIDVPRMLKSLIGKSVWDSIANMIEQPTKRYLATNINEILKNNGAEIAENLINQGVKDFASMPLNVLLRGKDEQIDQAINTVVSIYQKMIKESLPRILEAVNIPAIIEARINEMDDKETEELILTVMNKELKAIVWLGALLGMVMGCVNMFL